MPTPEKIRLGSVVFEAHDYASAGNAILGIRDSGKSYTATWFAERLMDAGIPIVAFDPIGIWRFLKVGVKGDGYPVVVAGGEHGDLPLTPDGAPEIVRAAMHSGVSVVLDLYSMELSKADWKRIVRNSVRALLYENKDHGLRHIFVEEAAEFVPQMVGRGDADGLVYAEMEKLARMGGNALLGYTLINQRAEEVNKAVLELCDNLILHRQKGRNSLNALSKWLDIGAKKGASELIRSLPMLPQGECLVWPAGSDTPIKTKVPAKRTFHPDRRRTGASVAVPGRQVDVSAFVGQMLTTLATLAPASKDAGKRMQPVAAAEPAPDLGAIEAAAVRRGREEVLAVVSSGLGAVLDLAVQAHAVAAAVDQLAEKMEGWLAAAPPAEDRRRRAAVDGHASAVHESFDVSPRKPLPRPVDLEGLHSAAAKMLTVLAQRFPARFSWSQAATLAGIKARGGHFNAGKKQLVESALIEIDGDLIQASARGRKWIGHVETPPATPSDVLKLWTSKLPKPGCDMLAYFVRRGRRTVSRDELAEALNIKPVGGHWNSGLSTLRRNQLIEEVPGGFRAAGIFLESGTPA